jgi:death-on-curing protein
VSEQEPLHPIDVTSQLHAAELLKCGPQVDNTTVFGMRPLFGSTPGLRPAHREPQVRHRLARRLDHGGLIERYIYGSLHLKATASLHALAKLPCPEHCNEARLALRARAL